MYDAKLKFIFDVRYTHENEHMQTLCILNIRVRKNPKLDGEMIPKLGNNQICNNCVVRN